MPDRKELKKRAKAALEENYWKSIFVCGILLVLSLGTVYSSLQDSITHFPEIMQDVLIGLESSNQKVNVQAAAVLFTLVGGIMIVTILVKLLVGILVENPVKVGASYFMVKSNLEAAGGEVADIAFAFDHHYLKIVVAMLFKSISVFLWSLLLVVPGIVRSYEYRLVPYLASEMNEKNQKEILKRSRQYMMGHKMEAFMLDLSFVPWYILGILTLGILDVLYVSPYKSLTDAAFYLSVKEMNEQNVKNENNDKTTIEE